MTRRIAKRAPSVTSGLWKTLRAWNKFQEKTAQNEQK
jgi:hypothetical protein